ncbi:fibronectin type III domain-containing protein [Marnyiella aurantia]|uniref:Fibronectin type III domain-containing protein n=1 Tax=Marnyiella aurantia TaxID=2758037 RepID=A0A7D7QZR5_9FLAO|nr:fibronectin type III domain-containing protein [Marnyiella aurantia]MBA5247331.1 fibronectin type III domain-containing protein [Marnyiella aurantia]QMS99091.1 fibronectin type III domain-containing protein [Marnyiella aurantia]
MIKFYQEKNHGLRKRVSTLLTGVGVLLLTSATALNMNAQVSAYSFAQSSGVFFPLTGGTVLATATGNTSTTNLNSAIYPVTLPFSFQFNNQSYTSLNVSTNGFITFGATAPTTSYSTPISGSTAYDGAVSAFGRDISSFYDVAGRTGDIRWETLGTAPNREVVIQWTNFRPTSLTGITSVYSFSFQIRLKETSNVVAVVYSQGDYLVGSTSYSSAINQVGLRGMTNADFNNRFNAAATPYTGSVPGTSNSDDQAFNTTVAVPGMPSDGLTYTWTPPTCYAPTTIALGAVGLNAAQIDWTASAQVPAMGYEIYFNTTGVAPDASTVLDGSNSVSVAAGSLSGTISGLTSGTQYYVWVRGKCSATDSSNWSSVLSFATTCNAVSAPYYESFDSTPVGSTTNPNAPACWSYLETAGSAGSGYISTSNALSAPHSYVLANGADTTGDVMLVSPQTSNLSDGTRQVRFSVRAGGNNYTMDVGTLSDPSNPGTFNVISTVSLTQTYVEHIVALPAASNQYVAFRHGLGGSSRTVYLDDIFVEKIPTCFEPTNLAVTAGSATTDGGVLTWTAPTTVAVSYELYFSTDPTAPVDTTVLNSSNSLSVAGTTATLSGLAPATIYYIWVRSVCSATDKSVWTPVSVTLATLCQTPLITGTTGTVICSGTATLSATGSAGTTLNWYDAATGGNQVGTGGTFTTPALTATTNYWVSAATSGSPTYVGPVSPALLGTSSNTNTNWNLLFTVSSNITLNSVDVFSGTAGQAGVIEILDANDVVVGSYPFTTSGAGASTPQTIPLNIALAPGNYSMKRTGAANLYRNSVGATFPYSTPELTITGTTFVNYPAYYFYFYNLNFTGYCESPRTMVTATVDCTMGTSEAHSAGDVKVYPNPFTEVINISEIRDVQSITVLDMSGRLVKTLDRPAAQINLSELNAGLYLINLKYKDGSSKSIKAVKK